VKKHISAIIVALIIVGVLVLYMVTFTVRWKEKALVLTFGKISRQETEPGLKWIWPW
jgi:regulator of protease activity HflC (stomatin/prohibitin superfamily)